MIKIYFEQPKNDIGKVELAAADLKKACELGDEFGCNALQYIIKNGP